MGVRKGKRRDEMRGRKEKSHVPSESSFLSFFDNALHSSFHRFPLFLSLRERRQGFRRQIHHPCVLPER